MFNSGLVFDFSDKFLDKSLFNHFFSLKNQIIRFFYENLRKNVLTVYK